MACQVGITTDLARRKREWERARPGLRNWQQIGGSHSTKSSAQAAEDRYANLYGCNSGSGGGGREYDTWYVYKFDY